jgi:ABC-type glutathione transport system ATPase component
MTVLILSGVVTEGDAYRCGSERGELEGAILIGGVDVVERIREVFRESTRVTVGIMGEQFDGDLFIETGWGYSEYTPMDPDQLKVGSHDLIAILGRHVDKSIRVIVADEPTTVLDVQP